MKRVIGTFSCAMLLVFGVAANAPALLLHDDPPAVQTIMNGPNSLSGDLEYGAGVGMYGPTQLSNWFGRDVGDLDTEVQAPPGDPTSFTIDLTGKLGYLTVKYDGWVSLYDLTAGGYSEAGVWDSPVVPTGKTHAWSHYRWYNGTTTIPDPAAVFLLGTACLVGCAGLRRRYKK